MAFLEIKNLISENPALADAEVRELYHKKQHLPIVSTRVVDAVRKQLL